MNRDGVVGTLEDERLAHRLHRRAAASLELELPLGPGSRGNRVLDEPVELRLPHDLLEQAPARPRPVQLQDPLRRPVDAQQALVEIGQSAVRRVMQPLDRAGSPEDCANAALYLASDRSAQVTGLVINVDGGTSVGRPPKPVN